MNSWPEHNIAGGLAKGRLLQPQVYVESAGNPAGTRNGKVGPGQLPEVGRAYRSRNGDRRTIRTMASRRREPKSGSSREPRRSGPTPR